MHFELTFEHAIRLRDAPFQCLHLARAAIFGVDSCSTNLLQAKHCADSRVIGERWTEAVNDWDVIGAYRWHRERIKRGTVAPLTAEDARQLLPKDKFALWSRKQL